MYRLKTIQTAIVLVSVLWMGCEELGDCERGRGPIVSQQLTLENFHGLKLSGSDKVYISQGPDQKVRVEGEQNIIDRISLDVRQGVWDIRTTGCIRRHEQLVFYVTLPDIRQLSLSGSGDIIGENPLTSAALLLEVTASGAIALDVVAPLKGEVTGSGRLSVTGSSESVEVEIEGSGEFDAYSLQAKEADLTIKGSGNAYVTVLDKLDVDIMGSGNVYYRGSPVINTSISGSGKLIDKN